MNAMQVSGRSPFEVLRLILIKFEVTRNVSAADGCAHAGQPLEHSAVYIVNSHLTLKICAAQAVAQDGPSMVDTAYPTDELSHPEYVNDDFRMFTFKVRVTGISCSVALPATCTLIICGSGSTKRAPCRFANDVLEVVQGVFASCNVLT